MAWIESHQSLRNHPKVGRLARLLDIPVPQAIGHLHCLWWWALDYAADGDLSSYEAADIASAAAWEGDPDCFIQALADCGGAKRAGFIEMDEDDAGGWIIHHWDEYAGRLIDRRKREAERVRAWREEQKQGTTNAVRNAYHNDDVLGTVPTVPTTPTVPTIPTHDVAAVPEENPPSLEVVPSVEPKARAKSQRNGVQPFAAFALFCEAAGIDEHTVPKDEKSRSCRYFKQMLDAGHSTDRILRCYRYLSKEHWRDSPVEPAMVARKIAWWVGQGEPSEPAATGTGTGGGNQHAGNRGNPNQNGQRFGGGSRQGGQQSEQDRYAYERELLRQRGELPEE